jgi:hypothetical protein
MISMFIRDAFEIRNILKSSSDWIIFFTLFFVKEICKENTSDRFSWKFWAISLDKDEKSLG